MLRLIDANLDRLGEGLRVLEDVARFLLDDAALSRQLKTLRHKLARDAGPVEQQLLAARRASRDVGALVRPPRGLARHKDLPTLVKANARRVQESLRVLEEFARLPDASLPVKSAEFERSRFEVYDLEQRLVSGLLRHEKMGRLAGLHLVLDMASLEGRDPVEVAVRAVAGGAAVVQLRAKQGSQAELLKIARKIREVCHRAGRLFIINDHLDLALAVEADGLHLGQHDLPLPEARRLLPVDRLIGCSASILSQATRAQAGGADYVGVGAVYPTLTKDARLAGLDTLRRIRGRVSLPLIAIGGINRENIEEAMKAGADGAAVISAVLGAKDIEKATRDLVRTLEQFRQRECENGRNDP